MSYTNFILDGIFLILLLTLLFWIYVLPGPKRTDNF